ncbi:hypothetical protein [Roseixanthobacter pseudopolyaromaticivorans]|uniref:hypothetical protein n=1 Tax=Xanthobacteraceae TaxID=335928 RepID=UPI0037285CC1
MSQFDIPALADEAKLSEQEFESFVTQCGVTRDANFKLTEQQMDRLRERCTSKWALAEFMERVVEKRAARANERGGS